MKLIAKTAVVLAKAYVFLCVLNELSYLEYKVKALETEVGKLKGAAEG